MKKIVRLTERDLTRLVKRVMNESVVFDELKGYYNKCRSQPTNSTSNSHADEIYDSIDGIGTDEGKLIGAFKKMKTFGEFCSTINSYLRIYKSDMLDDIDGDVDSDDIWKELSRTVRGLYEKRITKLSSGDSAGNNKLLANAKQCGHNSVEEYKASNWYCKPSNTNSSDQNSELLSNAKQCGHNSVEEYKNSGWACGGGKYTSSGVRNQTTGSGGSQRNVLKQDLTLGSKGPDVAAIQSKLGLPPDMGIATYGPKTKSAVMEFQKKIKMPATGIVDNETFNAIMSISGTKNIVKESLSDRKGDLYSSINRLIDREFDDVETSDVVEVLNNILDSHKGRAHRQKKGMKPISKDDVLRNFNRNN